MSNYQLSINNYQLPKGYKQTEVGAIPEDWDVKVIGDIADVKTGPFGSALHESDYVTDGTPIITVEHLGDLGVEHFNLPMVSDEDRSRLKAYALKEGDVVFSRVGSIDRNALIRKLEDGWLFSGRLLRVRINSPKDYPHYLSYHFHSEPFKQRVREVAVGQTMPSLNTQLLKGVQVVLPTPEEQRAIATALSDVDALIAALDKLIAKKRYLKTATMQQLLTGKKRLPGFGEGKGYKQTDVGVIPEDWNVVPLGEIGQSLIGLTYRPEDIRDFGTLVLRSSNVQNDQLAYRDNVYVDSELPLPSRVIVEEGDILICVRNGSRQLIGKCALIDAKAEGNAFGAFMSVFRTKCSKFVFYQFQSDIIQTQINEIMGATINQITNKDLIAFQIPLPPTEEEQRAIATVLSDMDAEIAALEARRAKTQAIKQGMMQQLLTGKVRLLDEGIDNYQLSIIN